jgi:hypothetical protein
MYFYPPRIGHKYQGEALDVKLHKISHSLFKVFYFTFISILGYFAALRYLPSLSPRMFGTGDIEKISNSNPTLETFLGMKVYYIISFTYHFDNTLIHMASIPQNDFFEMMCHHVCTLILVWGSYVSGFTQMGSQVLFLMDNGDICIGIIRVFMDWAHWSVTIVSWAGIMVSFSYFRLYITYRDMLGYSFLGVKGFLDNSRFLYSALSILLFVITILNVYWFVLIFNMGFSFLGGGKIKDTQHRVKEVGDEDS